jgi:AmiR/NasT family two-component response regulator
MSTTELPHVIVTDDVPNASSVRGLLNGAGFPIVDGGGTAPAADRVLIAVVGSPNTLRADGVVVIDGERSSTRRSEAAAAGAMAYFSMPLDEDALVVAVRAAAEARRAIRELERRIDNLVALTDTNRHIATAVGLLMERSRLSQAAAYERLRRSARVRRVRISDVAQDLLSAHEALTVAFDRLQQADGSV